MSVKLIRKSSIEPNITNRDDAGMIRYAYGGRDGYVKNYGEEINFAALTGKFTVKTGKIVLQGWETNVDNTGWSINVFTTGTYYYSLYLEINLTLETAEIKSIYSTDKPPVIGVGDDLTKYPNGTARLLLYTFKSANGIISEVQKVVQVIEYENVAIHKAISDVQKNIDKLEKNTAEDIKKAKQELTTKIPVRELLYQSEEGAFSVALDKEKVKSGDLLQIVVYDTHSLPAQYVIEGIFGIKKRANKCVFDLYSPKSGYRIYDLSLLLDADYKGEAIVSLSVKGSRFVYDSRQGAHVGFYEELDLEKKYFKIGRIYKIDYKDKVSV